MTLSGSTLEVRAERFVPRAGNVLALTLPRGKAGVIRDISSTGFGALCTGDVDSWPTGSRLERVELVYDGERFVCGPAVVARAEPREQDPQPLAFVGFRFDRPESGVREALAKVVQAPHYVINELREPDLPEHADIDAYSTTIDKFYSKSGPDIFAKCTKFRSWMDAMLSQGIYQRLYRLTVMGALDHRIRVFDPILGGERELICFDSNSYLGLHRHPRVIERVIEVTRLVGYGTASAQLLCGTNRYLCELEEALSEFHGRAATVVFPTGFAANIGAINALIRAKDAVLRDRFAHASIHEGCRSSRAGFNKIFPHNDMLALDAMLEEAQRTGADGKLIVTDGVFSMHGRVAPLPELVAVARRHNARLMVDDAHGVGVLGATGGGIEEHFAMPGSVDVLMGTLSKALGAVGGYISGSRDLVNYLRFFAASGMFTTSLPAPICAGLLETLRLMREEPEHRERLWANINHFVPKLKAQGFIVSEAESPISTVFVGEQGFMYRVSQELFDAGVKCGSVAYPAVAKGQSILRFTLNARHTLEELDYTIDVLGRIARKFDILHRSREEIQQIGRALFKPRPHASLVASALLPASAPLAVSLNEPALGGEV